jgi:hypothetical protein
MTDHHFNYPTVVPLRRDTISGHASRLSPSAASPQSTLPGRPSVPQPTQPTAALVYLTDLQRVGREVRAHTQNAPG